METLGFVPKHYTMDPETEELLSDRSKLRDGMVVLLEHEMWRIDLDEKILSDEHFNLALERNRWCTVSEIGRTQHGERYLFTGTYEDGTKRRIRAPYSFAWLVKKDSIPPHITESGKYEAVFAAVRNAMFMAHENVGLTKTQRDMACDNMVKRIFGVFDQEM